MNALATSLQTYFTTFAHSQRDLSPNTIGSYRDTWRMLLKHLTATLDASADVIDFDALTATNVTGFLDYLEQERGNSAKTRNVRLTAIRAVLNRALPDHPEHAATITQVLAIPPKRTTRPVIEFLTTDEVDALLNAPDQTTRTGRRDHALLAAPSRDRADRSSHQRDLLTHNQRRPPRHRPPRHLHRQRTTTTHHPFDQRHSVRIGLSVGGHEIVPGGGHVAARWWPTVLPGGGQLICPR